MTDGVDAAAVVVALHALLPYCDVISVHLDDVAGNNARAAVVVLEQIGEIDILATGVSDDAGYLAGLVDRLRVELPAAGPLADELATAAARIVTRAGRLSEHGTRAVAGVQFEDIGRQMIGHITEAVDDLRYQLVRLGGYIDGELDTDAVRASIRGVEQLRDRHVMDSQRAAHALAMGEQHVVVQTPTVELF